MAARPGELVTRAARAVATSRSRSAVIVGTIVLVGYISGSFGLLLGRFRAACWIRLAFRATPRAFASRAVGLAFGRATMEFGVLGPLEVRRDGRAVALPGGKPRAVLAFLLLHANEPVSAERLAVALWGEDAPAGAAKTVQVHVSRLRRALGDDERSDHDAGRLPAARRPGRARRSSASSGSSRTAGARWRRAGRARPAGCCARRSRCGAARRWPTLALEPFAQAEIARLEEQRLAALEARVEADLAAGRHAELVAELQRLVAEHPLRERLHGQLMLALYRAGRQADALEAYRARASVWSSELGLEPAPELRELEQAILAHDPRCGSSRRPVPRPIARSRGADGCAIPASADADDRRERDLERLAPCSAMPAVRPGHAGGPAGVGKTRLAIEAAVAVASQLRDGAVFVVAGPAGGSPSTSGHDRARARRRPGSGRVRARRGLPAHLAATRAAAGARQLRARARRGAAGGRPAGRRVRT